MFTSHLDWPFTIPLHDGERPSTKIIQAISTVSQTSVESLPVLFDTIDPDALDAIFPSEQSMSGFAGSLAFAYAGYRVVIDAESINIYPDSHRGKERVPRELS
jgi:hypothetical protein